MEKRRERERHTNKTYRNREKRKINIKRRKEEKGETDRQTDRQRMTKI